MLFALVIYLMSIWPLAFYAIRLLQSDMQQRILLVAASLTLLAGGLMWWMLSRQFASFFMAIKALAAVTDSQQTLQPLPITCDDETGELIGEFNRLLATLAQREAVIAESHNLLLPIINTTQMRVFWKDLDLRYLGCNIVFAKDAGVGDPQSIVGMDDFQLVWADQAGLYRADDREVITTGIPKLFYEEPQTTTGGSVTWLRTSKVPLRNTENKIVGILGMYEDITERKRAEQRLIESESRLRTIIDNDPECVKIVDAHGMLTQMNPAGLAMIEAESLAQLLNQPILNIVAPEYHVAYRKSQIQVLAGESTEIQYETIGLKGTRRWVESHAVPIQDNGERAYLAVTRDITLRKQTDEKLKLSDLALKTVSQGIIITDIHQQIIWVNDAFMAITGYDQNEVLGRNCRFLQGALTDPETVAEISKVIERITEFTGEILNYRKDGSVFWNELTIAPMCNEQGKVTHFVGITRDISERKQIQHKLQLAANVFTHAREGIMITSPAGEIIDVNDMFTHITGYSREDVLGQNPRILSSGRQNQDFYTSMWRDIAQYGYWYGEIWNRRKNGEVYAEMLTISVVNDADGHPTQFVALFSDITTLKEHEHKLEHIAHYDALTGLPNRVLLGDRLHQAMAQAQRHNQKIALVYLDLDGFKAVNDSYGHEVGDQLLIELATRMKQVLREEDTLARLGGDEFVVILVNLSDIESCVPLLNRLLATTATPLLMGDYALQVSASLGITFYPQAEEADADQLLRQADNAMYQAKLAGKNRYHIFDAALDLSIRSHHESLERLRQALVNNEFELYYQPKVNMRTGAVIGAEALIRWQHPERGLLPPAEFLSIIEDHPLSVDLGEWVINAALLQMAEWHDAGLDISVSINICVRQLQQSNFVERLIALMSAYPQITPGCLELEILETSALEDMNGVTQVIETCRKLGLKFALDDFGTGYSSLTYLKHLPVNMLKIDQSFVRGMLDNPDDVAILDGVLGLARAFRRQVIAEGVETIAHGAMLLQLGCELAQGYAIARPMPASALQAWSATWRPDPAWQDLHMLSRDDLPLLFAGVEHRAWIAHVSAYLKDERTELPPMDHHQCFFGIWLDTEHPAKYEFRPTFQRILTLHQQIHALARELLALYADNQKMASLARLDELYVQRDILLAALRNLLQGNQSSVGK